MMKISKNYLKYLSITSFMLYSNQGGGVEATSDAQLPLHPNPYAKLGNVQPREIPKPDDSKKRKLETKSGIESGSIKKSRSGVSLKEKKNLNESMIIADFIKKGMKDFQIPSMKETQADLEGVEAITDQVIAEAFKGNPISMQRVGACYLRLLDFPIAQGFLFRAAQQEEPTAFWLLSTMIMNKHIEPDRKGIDKLLIDKAESLGSDDAKLYKKESGIR